MKKFEIFTDDFEFRFGSRLADIPAMTDREILDTYLSCDTRVTSNSLDPHLEGQYDSLEAALAAWEEFAASGSTHAESGGAVWLLRGDLAYLQEAEYDEDGDFVQGGDILRHSCEAYSPAEEAEQ